MVEAFDSQDHFIDSSGQNIVVLQGFGHCGIDWLHSFFSFSPGILTMPALSYYRVLKEQKREFLFKKGMLEKLISFFSDYFDRELHFQTPGGRIFYKAGDKEVFWNYVRQFFSKGRSLTRKDFFLALHYAYHKISPLRQDRPQVIVYHEHACFYLDEILSDFPDAKVLMIMRDPRASLGGYFRGLKRKFPTEPLKYNFYYTLCLEEWVAAYSIYKKFKHSPRYRVVKNEDLKIDLRGEMESICEWMEFPFCEALLREKNPDGSPWKIDSCYIARNEVAPETANFYTPEKIKMRWMEVLSPGKQIQFIETFFYDIFIEFSYPFETVKTQLNRKKLIWGRVKLLPYFLGPRLCRDNGIIGKRKSRLQLLKNTFRRAALFCR